MLSRFSFLIPVILASLVLSININKPFIGLHDFNGVQMGNAAKNYLEHGFLNLKFGAVISTIRPNSNNYSFYTSYLPTLPMLVTGSFLILGITDFAARLVPTIFSILGALYLFFLVQKIWNQKTALLTSVFYILNPMFIYFGNLPTYDVLILPSIITSFYYYLCWQGGKKSKDFFYLCTWVLIGGLIGWITLYLIPMFLVFNYLTKKHDRKIIIPILILFLTLILQFLHGWILTGDFLGGSMFSSLKSRISGAAGVSFGGTDFSYFNYLKKEISWFQSYFTRTMLALSFAGFIYTFWGFLKKREHKLNNQQSLILVLLGLGLAHPILFSSAVFIHDYQNIYLLPFLSITSAVTVNYLRELLAKIHFSNLTQKLIILLILLSFVGERIEFTKALLKSDMERPGLNMAQTLNSLQNSPVEAVIVSPRFGSFHSIFADFYSKYPYLVVDETSFKKSLTEFKYAIMIDEDIQDQNFYKSLLAEHKFQKNGDTTIIYLNE